MKLSKNRLNKIKLKRNASRKKYKLRTQRGQYENSKKRNKRDTHLNRKTLKVYVGGERVLEVEENRKIDGLPTVEKKIDYINNLILKLNEMNTNNEKILKRENLNDKKRKSYADLIKLNNDYIDAKQQQLNMLTQQLSQSAKSVDGSLSSESIKSADGSLSSESAKSADGSDLISTQINNSITDSPSESARQSIVESNTAFKAAEALKKYECDPNSITDDVPDDENDADTKFDNLNNSILYCSEENKSELLDKWSTYIDNFEKKFNKKPSGFTMSISNECVNLFVGEMNYNIVPDTKEKAEEKFGQYIEMMERDDTDNGGKCSASIDAALKIYIDNMNKMYPLDQSETTSVSDDQSVYSSESDEQMNEQDQQMNEQDQQMNLTNDQVDSVSGQPSIITSNDITRIFTKIKDNQETETISMVKFIKFLVNETDNDSIMVRKAIGFDEPFTMTELVTGKDASGPDVQNLAKNSQIFNSLFKTYTEFENKNNISNGDNDSDLSSNITEINEPLFAKFINCGQYRNKSENIFDCKAVKIPDQSGVGDNIGQDLSPIANQEQNDGQTTDEPNNIILELHEKEYNDEFKRVTIDVLIRKDAAKDIIVKDYTGNSAIETLANIASSPN